MRRTTTVILVAAVLLALTAGAALASTISCANSVRSSGYCTGTGGADTMNGAPGPDYIVGLGGNDTLNGFAGEDKIDALNGAKDKGKDTVSGGPGNDAIAANDGVKDKIDCGTGSKDIAYSDKGLDIVSSNCEWRRSYDTPEYCSNDANAQGDPKPPWTGPPASWDSPQGPDDWPQVIPWVGEKIIWCVDGTPRDDKKLVGSTGRSDVLDSIWADKGDDTLKGGLGPDFLEGWSGNDILNGGAGNDFLYGDSSVNPAFAIAPGYDSHGFFKGAGKDKISGGPGDDFIAAVDNKKDTISCGGGNDVVQRDVRGVDSSTVTDTVANDCEPENFERPEDSLYWCRFFGFHRHRH
jgi:Ca2+-binding RTX toxin-like protein